MEVLEKNEYELNLHNWVELEKSAVELIHEVGNLWFDKSVELVMFRNQLVDRSASEIMNLHNYAMNVVKKPINVKDTLAIAKEINGLADLSPAKIDVGKLSAEWLHVKETGVSVKEFVTNQLREFLGNSQAITPKDVVLYGFGRIGRIAARELISQAGKGEQLRLRAIVTRSNSDADIEKRADLLRSDSVHGPFPGPVVVDLEKKAIIANGHTILMLAAKNPEDLDYTAHGIEDALIIDNTGIARNREDLERHKKAKGVAKVLLTAPASGDVPNIVFGVNSNSIDENETIFSAASCTTNAIVPVLKAVTDNFTIERGHIETVHSYTNDQNLLDNYHPKFRRGRSAAVNLVITETGADKAVSKVLPFLAGKLTGNAVRVPTPNVSLAIMNLSVDRATNRDEVNDMMRNAALNGELVEQIQYSFSNELVSSDCVGNPCPSIFDSPATIVSKDGKSMILYVWYDNEYGYTRQVIRLAKQICNVVRQRYY
jgi:glyceraldehyde 3-phosphate dehydrogenase